MTENTETIIIDAPTEQVETEVSTKKTFFTPKVKKVATWIGSGVAIAAAGALYVYTRNTREAVEDVVDSQIAVLETLNESIEDEVSETPETETPEED